MTDAKETRTEIGDDLLQSLKMQALGTLAGGLAHDFNNILTGIRSAVQLLILDLKDSPREREALREIETEVVRGTELIRQLLMFSKPHGTGPKCSSVNERVLDMRRLLRRTIPKNIEIDLSLQEKDLQAKIEPNQFEQIILNLAINSRDAMPRGGTLKITTSTVEVNRQQPPPFPGAKRRKYARIDVADTGTGIPAEALPRIFEPFYTSKGRQGGTGLGLSIVYGIVTRHAGHIAIESAQGKGTTMSIYLPAAAQRKVRQQPVTADSAPKHGSEGVLVVDDEQIISRSTARFLEKHGYKTAVAFDGLEAVNHLSANVDNIDLVLLDMEMPELCGLECLEKLLEIKPELKVIVLSGHILRTNDKSPVEAGARAFVQKPFDSNELLGLVRTILDGE